MRKVVTLFSLRLILKIETINLSNYKNHKFLCGDFYWLKKSGKKTLLFHAGTFANFGLLKKLLESNENIECHEDLDDEFIMDGHRLLLELSKCEFENERAKIREDFGTLLKKKNNLPHFNLVRIFTEAFYDLEEESEAQYVNNSKLLERLVSIASIVTCGAFLQGYLDFTFLKKIFNTILLSDIYLAQEKVSFSNTEKFSHEIAIHPGKALVILGERIQEQILKNLILYHEESASFEFSDLIMIRKCVEGLFDINQNSYIEITIQNCLDSIANMDERRNKQFDFLKVS